MADDTEDRGDDFRTIKVALRIIVSYDVGVDRQCESAMVYRFIHGRREVKIIKDRSRCYSYPGLIMKGGVDKIGQSVLLMREKDAEDFAKFLHGLQVPYTLRRVWQRPVDLV